MYSLRPHKRFNFVKYWNLGFKISLGLIAFAIVGFIVSTIVTGAPLTLGTEFSGGTSIQINDAGDVAEDELKDAFASAANSLGYDTQISSVQTATTMAGGNGYIVKTTDTVSTNASEIMSYVENALGIDENTVEIETIGASWGASVIWSSILAFILSCVGILIVIALRYREPRMGVIALVCLFHDMIILLGIYAWAGMIIHMEITSDVIAALLAIIGYSLYDTVVVFHRISRNSSPQMKRSMETCANESLNQVFVRSINTSITSIIPVFFMLILGTDTLVDFAFAMFIGMVVGLYSTLAISAPLYTKWKAKESDYARLEAKYPYEVVQPEYTKQMMLEDRKKSIEEIKEAKAQRKEAKAQEREEERKAKEAEREEKRLAEEKKKEEERLKAADVKEGEGGDFISLDVDEEDSTVPELFNSDPNTEVDFEDLVSQTSEPDASNDGESAGENKESKDSEASKEDNAPVGKPSEESTDDENESIVTTSVSYDFEPDEGAEEVAQVSEEVTVAADAEAGKAEASEETDAGKPVADEQKAEPEAESEDAETTETAADEQKDASEE